MQWLKQSSCLSVASRSRFCSCFLPHRVYETVSKSYGWLVQSQKIMGSYSIPFCLLEFQRIATTLYFQHPENSKDFTISTPLDSYIIYVFFLHMQAVKPHHSRWWLQWFTNQLCQQHKTEGNGMEFSLQCMMNKTKSKEHLLSNAFMVLQTWWISPLKIYLFRIVCLYIESVENSFMKIQNCVISDLETSDLMKHKHFFCLANQKFLNVGSNVNCFVCFLYIKYNCLVLSLYIHWLLTELHQRECFFIKRSFSAFSILSTATEQMAKQ